MSLPTHTKKPVVYYTYLSTQKIGYLRSKAGAGTTSKATHAYRSCLISLCAYDTSGEMAAKQTVLIKHGASNRAQDYEHTLWDGDE